MHLRYFISVFLTILTISLFGQENLLQDIELNLIIEPARNSIQISAKADNGSEINEKTRFKINSKNHDIELRNGKGYLTHVEPKSSLISVSHKESKLFKLYFFRYDKKDPRLIHLPLWLSILPPLLTILLALLFKEVIIALFLGILLGSFISRGLLITSIWESFTAIVDHYIINAVYDSGHISIMVFSTIIGGTVAIISKNGGMQGIINHLSTFANSAKNTQLVTWLMGIVIFFDDYANTLVVGNTMRPIMDKYNVSREKLAYIADSTAAPIACIAFITTWIGAELSYIQDATQGISINQGAYQIFFNSLKYMFYPILTLIFVLMLILKQKDFGPMLKAERSSSKKSLNNQLPLFDTQQTIPNSKKSRWYNAMIPILSIILITFAGLISTGYSKSTWASDNTFFSKLSQTIGNADSYKALLWGSSVSLLIAFLLTTTQKIMTLKETSEEMIKGFKSMLLPIIILILAWSLAQTVKELHTAEFFLSLLQGEISAIYFPLLIFIISASISFATGSSWGTMAILYPFVIPVCWQLSQSQAISNAESLEILYHTVSVVIAGSVFGDHCSPISDTSILSSLSSKCDHISHVKTQMPYAITVAVVSLIVATITVLGGHWLISIFVGIIMLYATIHFVGKQSYKQV